MAIGNDESWKRLATGSTVMSGDYIIEEGEVDEEDEEDESCGRERQGDNNNNNNNNNKKKKKIRRLRFLQNQHFVQTEVRLLIAAEDDDEEKEEEEAPALVSTGTDGRDDLPLSIYLPSSSLKDPPTIITASKASRSSGDDTDGPQRGLGWTLCDVNSTMAGMIFDFNYIDSHHATALAVMCLCPHLLRKSITSNLDLGLNSNEINPGGGCARGLTVGLGGGAFPMFAQAYLPQATHHVCDIDPGLLEIAVHYFGYEPSPKTTFVPCEGVSLLKQLAGAATTTGSGSSGGSGGGGL